MSKPALQATDQERVLLEACSLSPEECFLRMGSREKGLTEEEVEEKRREFGTNEVSTKQGGVLLR
ncbi:MAG: cation-transporting P-type ATPase, partial [Spirochaetia bacterium]